MQSSDQWINIDPILRTRPMPNIHAITGMYAKISRRTPERDVNVVEPVKFRVMKAVMDGMSNNQDNAPALLNQKADAG